MDERPDPDVDDPQAQGLPRPRPVPGPIPGRLDARLLTPGAPLPPGAGIRAIPGVMDPLPASSHLPAWAPDPTGRHQWRWWGGVAWTDHVADDGVASEDPLDSP